MSIEYDLMNLDELEYELSHLVGILDLSNSGYYNNEPLPKRLVRLYEVDAMINKVRALIVKRKKELKD